MGGPSSLGLGVAGAALKAVIIAGAFASTGLSTSVMIGAAGGRTAGGGPPGPGPAAIATCGCPIHCGVMCAAGIGGSIGRGSGIGIPWCGAIGIICGPGGPRPICCGPMAWLHCCTWAFCSSSARTSRSPLATCAKARRMVRTRAAYYCFLNTHGTMFGHFPLSCLSFWHVWVWLFCILRKSQSHCQSLEPQSA